MSRRNVDVVIVGAGLAGACIAWELQRQGMDFVLVDGGLDNAASQVSAGLMTPITGKRLVKSWKWDEFWEVASNFYEKVAPDCFETLGQLRLFRSAAEKELFARRREDVGELIANAQPQIPVDVFHAPWGGFEMRAGRLHVRKFVERTLNHFADQVERCVISCDDILVQDDVCDVEKLGVLTKHVVFCQGLQGADSKWFPLRFKPAKGEILRLRIPGLQESRVINSGVWLAPDPELGSEYYRCGATYKWEDLTPVPTPVGQLELQQRLQDVLKLPFEVVDQVAGVRPALVDSLPVCGVHPQHSQLAILNGLGSKGALQTPFLARHLVRTLAGEAVNDPEFYRSGVMATL